MASAKASRVSFHLFILLIISYLFAYLVAISLHILQCTYKLFRIPHVRWNNSFVFLFGICMGILLPTCCQEIGGRERRIIGRIIYERVCEFLI